MTKTSSSGDLHVLEGINEELTMKLESPGNMPDVEAGGAADAEETRLLETIPASQQLNLTFTHISGHVPSQLMSPSMASKVKKAVTTTKEQRQAAGPDTKQILHDITGQVLPGEVLALMGPSGSGKTSLLSVVSGRAPKMMKTEGEVTINNKPLTKITKRRMGFVTQDDLLYETLTVNETLMYAARLRLPKDTSYAEKAARVATVVAALGLVKCQDTIIGGFFRRGISGGERKRVCIGHELLINPAILLLDEPTSGLDSTTAMHLLSTLRQLAAGGRAVVTTIHQPSSRLYQQLDKLLLLAEGHPLYYGSADQVVHWFNHLGFPLPYGINVADFILDLAMGEVSHPQVQGHKAVQALYRTYEQYGRSSQGRGYRQGDDLSAVQLITDKQLQHQQDGKQQQQQQQAAGADDKAGSSASSSSGAADEDELEMPSGLRRRAADGTFTATPSFMRTTSVAAKEWVVRVSGKERGGASYSEQLRVLFSRSIKVRRFESLSGQKFFQLFMVALVTGLFWFQRGAKNTIQAAQDTVGLVFFETLFPSFGALFGALFTFPNDYRMLLKERASGMYQLSAFYLARTSSDLPMDCVYPMLFVIIVYFMGGLKLTAAALFANAGTIMLMVLIAQTIGLLLGAIFMNPKTAQTVSTVLMLTFMLVGGYYVRDIPAWISWVKYLSFLYWGFNLVLKAQFTGLTYYNCGGPTGAGGSSNVAVAQGCVPVQNLSHELLLPVDVDASPVVDIVVLLSMLVALRLAVYWVLRHKTSGM